MTIEAAMTMEGGCLCGAIRYRVTGAPSVSGLCHCETCRRTASAPSLPFVTFRRSEVSLLRGSPAAYRSSAHVVRTFCATCGSALSYLSDKEPDDVDVMTCSLDDPDAFPPQHSVWTSEKLAWDHPNPDCPAFPRTRHDGAAG